MRSSWPLHSNLFLFFLCVLAEARHSGTVVQCISPRVNARRSKTNPPFNCQGIATVDLKMLRNVKYSRQNGLDLYLNFSKFP